MSYDNYYDMARGLSGNITLDHIMRGDISYNDYIMCSDMFDHIMHGDITFGFTTHYNIMLSHKTCDNVCDDITFDYTAFYYFI